MRTYASVLVLAFAAVLLVFTAAVVADDEEKVDLDKLPKAVVDAVKQKFPNAKMVGAEKEVKDKKTLIEVNLKVGETVIDITLTEDGKIVEVEKSIAANDLPKDVAKALEEAYPHATYKKVEIIMEGEKTFYEVLLVANDKKTWEVKMDPMGKVIEKEEKKSLDD